MFWSTTEVEKIKFVRYHRMGGKPTNGRSRPVLVKFHFYPDKEKVWNQRRKLKDSNVWLSEDFPPEVRNRRQVLMPIYKAALKTEGVEASLSRDRLFLNRNMYTVHNLHMLPEALKLKNICTATIDGRVCFYTRSSPFSNFFPAKFSVGGVDYCCSEQYYLSTGAEVVGDREIADKIMLQSDPAVMKSMYNTLQDRHNDMSKWNDGLKKKTMSDALIAKFSQNPHLKDCLLATKDAELVEASPIDTFWGVGVALKDISSRPRDEWPGENILGSLLQDVRATLSR